MATKWACLGTGTIARDFFLALKENLPQQDHELVAVASRDLSRAQQFAEEMHFNKAYGSYDDITKDDDVEVVYIATVSKTHVELSIKMLEAGKHVLCEKPMAMNLKEAERVFETARKTKKLFMEGFWSKHTPGYEQIRKELAAGTLGDIRLVQANLCIKLSENPETDGGGMMDVGVYTVLFASMVFNEMPEQIQATGLTTDNKDMDIGGSIILKYKNGGMASLNYHMDTDMGSRSASIMGTKGMIQIPDLFFCPTTLSTPTGTYEYLLKPGNYNLPNSAGLHYEAKAMRETIKNVKLLKNELDNETMLLHIKDTSSTLSIRDTHARKLDNDVHPMADSKMVTTIAEEVCRQIGIV